MNSQPQTIEEQFVTYEIAIKLKQLGFNEVCLAHWIGDNLVISYTQSSFSLKNNSTVLAPLWQQAFDWFREKYNHSGEVYFYSSADFGKWHFDIEPLKLDRERYTTPIKGGFETYNLARQACLEKLIEIFKK